MKISVSKTVKIGVGKFECVDAYAMIEYDLPEAATKEAVDSAYTKAWARVDEQINKQIEEVQSIVKPDSVFKAVKQSGSKVRRST